ncbi:DUF898 family protein [Candidatus Odyssella thessalonicensis]|uniref:DUF898 family protein n=1 Tax=Candidatus Odyssella thessalonicensis TaxID=84647 RepID=UPI000225B1E1|nr:DUF898 family protein [Candidatus Odyssella thessalonicensis]
MSNTPINQLEYKGDSLTLFMLYAQLLGGCLLTGGIYYFWGRVAILRYTIGSILINQTPYQYLGTGKELCLSFLRFCCVCLGYLLFNYGILWYGIHTIGWNCDLFIQTVFGINAIVLSGLLFYGVHRSLIYYFSRLAWKGVRYQLAGSSWEFTKLCLKKSFLNIITCSFTVPQSTLEIYGSLINQLYYGDQKYRFQYETHNLLKPHLISLLLLIPTLGLSRLWYQAKLHNFIFDHMKFMDLEFRNTMRPTGLISLYLSNLIIIIASLGLGIPFAVNRSLKFYTEHLCIVGDLNRKRLIKG